MNATEQNLETISQVESSLKTLEAEYSGPLPDFDTPEGYERAKELKKPLVKLRTTGDKARLAATKSLREEVDRINGMWNKDILPRLSALEDPLTEGIKAVDDRKKAEAEAAARAEAERIENIENRLARIKSAPSDAVSLEQVVRALVMLDDVDLAEFDEFADAAIDAIDNARKALTEKRDALAEQKAEAERMEQQRKELAEQQAKIDAENNRIEDERRQIEAAKAEAKRQAEEAEREKQRKAEEEQRAKEAAERAEREKAEAIERAKQEAIEAERQRVEAEEAARQAEAEKAKRKAARAPDVEKLRAWLASIPALPKCKTDDGKAIAEQATACLDELSAKVAELESE